MEEYNKFDEQGLFSGNTQTGGALQNSILNLDELNNYYNSIISSGSISTTTADSTTITTDSTGTSCNYYENYSPKSSWLFDKNTDTDIFILPFYLLTCSYGRI